MLTTGTKKKRLVIAVMVMLVASFCLAARTFINLAEQVTGILAVANGGTGVTTSTGSGSVVLSNSPALAGTPTAPTPATGDSSTTVATTAFVQAAANAPASPVQSGMWGTVDAPPGSPTIYDDEFNSSSLNSQWSWVNQGSATATLSKGMLSIFIPKASGDNERGIMETLPTGVAYQFDAKLNIQIFPTNFVVAGMALYDGTKLMIIGASYNRSGQPCVDSQASVTSAFVDQSGGLNIPTGMGVPLFVRVKYDLTNLIFSISYDGVSWRQIYTTAPGAFFATVPTKIGFLGESNNSSTDLYFSVDWIRRTL